MAMGGLYETWRVEFAIRLASACPVHLTFTQLGGLCKKNGCSVVEAIFLLAKLYGCLLNITIQDSHLHYMYALRGVPRGLWRAIGPPCFTKKRMSFATSFLSIGNFLVLLGDTLSPKRNLWNFFSFTWWYPLTKSSFIHYNLFKRM